MEIIKQTYLTIPVQLSGDGNVVIVIMPGRQYSTLPSVKQIKSSKRKAKRSQNALAVAEQESPVRSKVRRNRLGESEPEPNKRKRTDADDNLEVDNGGDKVKRQRGGDKDRYGHDIERGSDSSGNEWYSGYVEGDDDSDIDSDEAMAESDDEGAAIRGSVAHTSNKKPSSKASDSKLDDTEIHSVDLRENEDGGGAQNDENDSFGDEAVDLAAMLDDSDDSEGVSDASRNSGASSEHSIDDESEGGVSTKPNPEEEESVLSYSGDEDEVENSAKLASLQALVSTMNEQDHKSTRPKIPIDAQESTTPSEFGLNPKRKLTVADLVSSVTDPKLRHSLKLLTDDNKKSSSKRGGIPKKLDVPLPKRQQDQLDRAAAYERSKETLNRWIDTVKHNRRAEHLSFPLKDPKAAIAQDSTRLPPTSQSQPLNDLESTIQDILQDSGLGGLGGKPNDQLQAFEELETNKIPIEEVQARRAELRRARELLFREEIRAKRIKKIKSKTYRKVHRKERERNAQQEKDALVAAGVDDSDSERERKDRRRAEERMGARHRESKWAKGVKESGRARWDEDARGGVTEMARRGEELKRRIEGKAVADDDDSAIGSESAEDDDSDDTMDRNNENERKDQGTSHRLNGHNNGFELSEKGSRLASMDFMKNAENARRARNEADLENHQRDLAGEQTAIEDGVEGPGRMIFGPAKSKRSDSRALPPDQKGEFEERQDSDLENEGGHGNAPEDEDLAILVEKPELKKVDRLLLSDSRNARGAQEEPFVKMNDNPWLMPHKKGSNIGKKKRQESDSGPVIVNTIPPELAISPDSKSKPRSAPRDAGKADGIPRSAQRSNTNLSNEASDHEDDDDDNLEKSPFVLRNQDLVRKAFAGDEVVAKFEAEKQAMIEEEEEKIIDNTLPGWGSWTGAGLGKKQQKRNKGKVLIKQPGIAKEKRQDAKLDRVIINEKRVKKNGKYLASSLPHPFETKQQYQRSLRMPVGPEFTTKLAFQDATKPRILMKQGIIAPMAKPIV